MIGTWMTKNNRYAQSRLRVGAIVAQPHQFSDSNWRSRRMMTLKTLDVVVRKRFATAELAILGIVQLPLIIKYKTSCSGTDLDRAILSF
jgi:hypothetical protein